MRREGFEIEVSKPQVIFKEKDGQKLEPMELASIEVPEEFSGTVIEMFGKRLGVMKDMRVDDNHDGAYRFCDPDARPHRHSATVFLPQQKAWVS